MVLHLDHHGCIRSGILRCQSADCETHTHPLRLWNMGGMSMQIQLKTVATDSWDAYFPPGVAVPGTIWKLYFCFQAALRPLVFHNMVVLVVLGKNKKRQFH